MVSGVQQVTAAPAVFRESFHRTRSWRAGERASAVPAVGAAEGWGGDGGWGRSERPLPGVGFSPFCAFLAAVFLSLQSSQFQCSSFFQSPRPEKLVPPKEAASWWGFPLQSVVLEGSSSISVLGFRFSLSPTV